MLDASAVYEMYHCEYYFNIIILLSIILLSFLHIDDIQMKKLIYLYSLA